MVNRCAVSGVQPARIFKLTWGRSIAPSLTPCKKSEPARVQLQQYFSTIPVTFSVRFCTEQPMLHPLPEFKTVHPTNREAIAADPLLRGISCSNAGQKKLIDVRL
jgi:hypothetical protein